MTKLCDFQHDTPQDFDIPVVKIIYLVKRKTCNKWYNLKYYCQQSITNATFNATLSVQSVHNHKVSTFKVSCTHAFRRLVRSLTALLIGSCGMSFHINCKAAFSSAIVFD